MKNRKAVSFNEVHLRLHDITWLAWSPMKTDYPKENLNQDRLINILNIMISEVTLKGHPGYV